MNKTFHVRADDGSLPRKALIDQGDGTHAEQVVAKPPANLMTGTTKPRLRVDVAQTGFFEGREFRTFKEWQAATTASYVIKVVVPVNVILFGFGVTLDEGAARVETVVGGTEGGTFSETLPAFPRNTMTERPLPIYTAQVVMTAGGTHTGGTLLDVLHIKAAGNSNFANSVGGSNDDERGIAAGTYYFRITLTGAIGVLKARWEERP